jgi:hypothetical protein
VVVRSLSTDLNFEYTAIGVTTHLAARMEQMASPGCVLITAGTLHLAGSAVAAHDLGMRSVAGLPEPVAVYELISVDEVRTRDKAAAGSSEPRPFVGREAEMGSLHVALARANDARPEAVLIIGEAGVGKSRLLEELAGSAAANEWQVHRTECFSYGLTMGYRPVAKLVRTWLGAAESDEPGRVVAKVASAIPENEPSRDGMKAALLALLDSAAPEGDLGTVRSHAEAARHCRSDQASDPAPMRESAAPADLRRPPGHRH